MAENGTKVCAHRWFPIAEVVCFGNVGKTDVYECSSCQERKWVDR